MAMETYNIYECKPCKMFMDLHHSLSVSLKILCPTCSEVMQHRKQIDLATFKDEFE